MMDKLIDTIRILGSTNTQTRRLGYLIQVCKIIGNNPIPKKILSAKLEEWANQNNHYLHGYASNKGILRESEKSYGSKRYIKLAEQLGLLVEMSGIVQNSIMGDLLNVIYCEQNVDSNPFMLSDDISILLLFQLLVYDADYIFEVLHLSLRLNHQQGFIKAFQASILNRFEIMEANLPNAFLRSDMHGRIITTSQWKKPDIYLEHIVLPRLHWLLDLKLFEQNSFVAFNIFELSDKGKVIYFNAPEVQGHKFINRDWCRNQLIEVWVKANNSNMYSSWDSFSLNEQFDILEEYIHVISSAMGKSKKARLSASQVILFIIIKLVFDRNIVVGFNEIRMALRNISKNKHVNWQFFWSAIDEDGLIVIY